MAKYIFILIFVISISACVSSPDYPITPVIEFNGFSKSEMNQGSLNNDSIFLSISFTDGDGDIGHEGEDATRNLFVKDKRTGEFYDRFKVPKIPDEGVGNGVSGTIQILMYTTCCTFPDNIPPCESPALYPTNELVFEVYMLDRAGNESNTITTPPITLLCN